MPGNTSFASTTAACDALPDDMKRKLGALRNVHSYVYCRGKNIQAQKTEQARGDRVVQEHVLTDEHLKQVPDADMLLLPRRRESRKAVVDRFEDSLGSRLPGNDEV